MYILTADEIRAVETDCFKYYSTEAELMLKAGTACAESIIEKYGDSIVNSSVAVLCGNGKNAGDGFVIARLLYAHGANAKIILCDKEPEIAEPLKYYNEADEGHDEDISKEDIIAKGLVSREDYEQLEKYTRALYERGCEMAADKGLILVDTKYEFGKRDGRIVLMDEIHTPDSSRYFYAQGYEQRLAAGERQKQLSKEFVREWLMAGGFQGREGEVVPEMTDEVVNGITDRYIELYEHITGEKFQRAQCDDLAERVRTNIEKFLSTRK